ncbi:MAG: glycosyl hydrolase 115 family protein [Bacteroidota bacterium]
MIIRSTFYKFLLITIISFLGIQKTHAVQFDLVTAQNKVAIYYDKSECKLDSIVASQLASDIERVSGYRPLIATELAGARGNIIIIGSINSKLITGLQTGDMAANLQGKWECYGLKVLNAPFKQVKKALIIAGSDFRGTAYGVFDISARIGVTPWYWWADAKPVKHKIISLNIPDYISATPSVKFRGIFINDEDWGLQPWAAKTFEPETKDIGPKTYAKVFELLLRLKANLIWPAMHPSTKAFYHYPGNLKVAEDYQIVLGSSHAEPMLRNNVSEWNGKTMGSFNYITNKEKVSDYWESRVKESSHVNGIYTIGMRGVHDSGIEGVKTIAETVPLVERIFNDQREMLKKYINPDITKVPQAFTAYKEVLDVYNAGLKVPEDAILVWPDDNYGYIQRLNDTRESARSGGSGVYYHASYWGRPHDYLWLSSTSPGLIREEMTKAYDMNDRNLWVVNVGDIKPAEYDMQFFLDMAYHIQPFYSTTYAKKHLKNWISDNIDAKHAGPIADVLDKYYQLAFERRPEFMGWNQTEPNTPVRFTAYNHQFYGDQAQKRADAYSRLEQSVKSIQAYVAADKLDSYFQLVYYPVVGTSLINKKFLFRDKAYLYAQQGRVSAVHYDSLSKAAYEGIVKLTTYYNTKLSGGKWANMMSMQPRNLAVYQAPEFNYKVAVRPETWQVLPEGTADSTGNTSYTMPVFNRTGEKHFIDVFLTKNEVLNYKVKTSAPWIGVSQQDGRLNPKGGQSQQRLWVAIDWEKVPSKKEATGAITIQASGKTVSVAVEVSNNSLAPKGYPGFIENNGYISIYARSYQSKTKHKDEYWGEVSGLGGTEMALEALPLSVNAPVKTDLSDAGIKKYAAVSYDFYTSKKADADLQIYTIPTYPINRNFEMRYAVSVDDGPATMLNFKTTGRSEEWKQAVLSNTILRNVKIPELNSGHHKLRVYFIDPGVILDRIVVDLGGLRPFYGLLPETRMNNAKNGTGKNLKK